MSAGDMRLIAAVSGFVIFLLSASVIQGLNDWGVTYSHTQICAIKGSTVEIHCSYTYPSRTNYGYRTVERAFWITDRWEGQLVDLRTDPEYAGRVQYSYDNNQCTLRISDVRESDRAVYKFRFMTNRPDVRYTGEPGVTLSVTGLQVQIGKISSWTSNCKSVKLKCHSSCLTDQTSYIWYKDRKKMKESGQNSSGCFYRGESTACAAREHEASLSPSLCVFDTNCNRVAYADRRICAFKGSSVDISCRHNYNYVRYKFWFNPERNHHWRDHTQPEDLTKDFHYKGRVRFRAEEERRSTLTITDLRENDSAEYHFKFTTERFELGSSSPGTTLTVTDSDLQVQVIWSSTGPRLICHSSCLPIARLSFVWYKNKTKKIQGETSTFYRGYVDPADSYSCAYQSYRSPPVYAPTVPLLKVGSPGEIMKDNSVTLTCSSDANPEVKYTWFKENQSLLSKEPELVFSSIQSSDSGEYYCTAENELGRKTSEHISINVTYAPKLPSVSVSPSDEIVEGSSVTLTCSSDANPAANYTWYKENQIILQGPESIHHFTSISSEDSGNYHCQSENHYGRVKSTSVALDVQYAPKLPSVSVSPSDEIVEGSSVNLTCSSDANPAANYTWYKEGEDSPKASGQIFTITDFRAEHSGNYYCEAQNNRGRSNSTLHLTVLAGALKSAAAGTITAVLLAIVLLAVFLWMRRKKSFTQQSSGGERPNNRAQLNMDVVYDVPPAPTIRQPEKIISSTPASASPRSRKTPSTPTVGDRLWTVETGGGLLGRGGHGLRGCTGVYCCTWIRLGGSRPLDKDELF
ncbi:B-cell receptor CD22-like [Anoplopoma fimbria]|uniref:B-cell receptor CD22-like n=1 Tax=Anoplopoma fimbria TaxID=229290 RepID=UPI0023EC92E0|nr:B-cell receptor CD22-like [Anoplopoma fimbria]